MKIPLHCVGKKSFATFVHEKTDTFIGIISEETIALHGNDNLHHLHIPTRNWYIYWDENVSHCAPQGSPQCILTIILEIFYHLLYTKEYFITHTHIYHWRFHSHLWTFVSQTRNLAISIIWLIKNHLRKQKPSWKQS